ncbi:hypothetical protein [Caulobacter sp. 17J65-9]|nr:hypothetical protein [Caulobacter sp. 17J65-9]
MKDKDKNMQHAMFSFALLGGLLVGSKGKDRLFGKPLDFSPLPRKPR